MADVTPELVAAAYAALATGQRVNRLPNTETLISIAAIRLMLNRIAPA
jgi:hypothetical protein